MQPIIIQEYDPTWPRDFATLKAGLWTLVNDLALSIEHVGSTSVPGLAAKPIIDIDIVAATPFHIQLITEFSLSPSDFNMQVTNTKAI